MYVYDLLLTPGWNSLAMRAAGPDPSDLPITIKRSAGQAIASVRCRKTDRTAALRLPKTTAGGEHNIKVSGRNTYNTSIYIL